MQLLQITRFPVDFSVFPKEKNQRFWRDEQKRRRWQGEEWGEGRNLLYWESFLSICSLTVAIGARGSSLCFLFFPCSLMQELLPVQGCVGWPGLSAATWTCWLETGQHIGSGNCGSAETTGCWREDGFGPQASKGRVGKAASSLPLQPVGHYTHCSGFRLDLWLRSAPRQLA